MNKYGWMNDLIYTDPSPKLRPWIVVVGFSRRHGSLEDNPDTLCGSITSYILCSSMHMRDIFSSLILWEPGEQSVAANWIITGCVIPATFV